VISNFVCTNVRGGADKSLARPGRKQVTATKLGTYSTYSPRSSVHFLACSNFCKPLKKKIRKVVRPTRSLRQQWPLRRKKNGDFWIVFSVQRTGCSLTGPDPENRVGDQDIWSPGRPQKLFRWLAPLTFVIHVQALRDPLRGELLHAQIFMNDGPNPLTSDAQLLSYYFRQDPAVFQD